MHNILQGAGKAALLHPPLWEAVHRKELYCPYEILKDLAKIYIDNGTFESKRQYQMFVDIYEGAEQRTLTESYNPAVLTYYKTKREYYENVWNKEMKTLLSKYFIDLNDSITSNEKVLLLRHFVYIPYGIMYEMEIELANQDWYRTEGQLDYWGKVDFIDFEAKKLYTVKATKSLNKNYLIKQIRNYLAGTVFDTFDIVLIHMDTSTWLPFSGVIDKGAESYILNPSQLERQTEIIKSISSKEEF